MTGVAHRCRCLPFALVFTTLISISLSYFYLNDPLRRIYTMERGDSDKNFTSQSIIPMDDSTPKERHHCLEKRNHFVYLKVHKTASKTLSAIVRRFGYRRNLSFILPISRRNNLGWPYPLNPGMYRPKKTDTYCVSTLCMMI